MVHTAPIAYPSKTFRPRMLRRNVPTLRPVTVVWLTEFGPAAAQRLIIPAGTLACLVDNQRGTPPTFWAVQDARVVAALSGNAHDAEYRFCVLPLKAFLPPRPVTFSVTYEIVTDESATEGEIEERGWIAQNLTLREALRHLHATRTNEVDGPEAIESNQWPMHSPRWITVTNGREFRTGEVETRSLHMPDTLTAATRCRIARLAGVNQ